MGIARFSMKDCYQVKIKKKCQKIFASKYKLYLPSEEELLKELNREYLSIENYTDKGKDKEI